MTAGRIASVIPASAVPAARRQARSAARRTLPLARPVRFVPQDVVYGLARVDASGRICERAIITALGWAGGDRLTLTAEAGVVTARRDPGGLVPWDLPRVHPGGFRQGSLGHPKLCSAQADSFTQVHDRFNTSGERPRHCDRADLARPLQQRSPAEHENPARGLRVERRTLEQRERGAHVARDPERLVPAVPGYLSSSRFSIRPTGMNVMSMLVRASRPWGMTLDNSRLRLPGWF